jgi:hypothetical protein
MPKTKRVAYSSVPSGVFRLPVPGVDELTLSPSLWTKLEERLQGAPLTASLKVRLLVAMVRFKAGDKPRQFDVRWRESDVSGQLDEYQLHKLMDEVEDLRRELHAVQKRIAAIDALVAERRANHGRHHPSRFAHADEAATFDRLIQRCSIGLAIHAREFRKRGRGRPLEWRREVLHAMVDDCLKSEGISVSTYSEVRQAVQDVIDEEADRLEGRAIKRKGEPGSNNRRFLRSRPAKRVDR